MSIVTGAGEAQPVLRTDRLVLRPFRIEDAPRIQRFAGDAAGADTALDIPHPFEDGMAEAWIDGHAAGFASGTLAVFAITDPSPRTGSLERIPSMLPRGSKP